MTNHAYIYDAVRTPRSKGKQDGSLHEVKPIDLAAGLLRGLQVRHDLGSQMPMPAELLEAVRKFLKDDVAASQSGRSSFLAKVAANSLGIAQRELLHGPALPLAEGKRLQNLFGAGELEALRWKLVNGLRGELALDTPGLGEHLRHTVAGQLAIDQPNYSALTIPKTDTVELSES